MYQLQVENMSCGHCVRAVTEAVKEVDAGAIVDINLDTKSVTIDSSGPLEKITAAIVEAGYPVLSAA